MDSFAAPAFALADVTREETFTGARLVELTAEELRAALASAHARLVSLL
jgi:hypothetical protein